MLVAWLTCTTALLCYAVLFGTLEEQLFYLLVVPAVVSIPCAIVLLIRRRGNAPSLRVRAAIGVALAVMLGWSAYTWCDVHTVPDEAFTQVRQFLRTGLPEGARVGVTKDPQQFLLEGYFQGDPVTSVADLRRRKLDYVVLGEYQTTLGYGSGNPELYKWIAANSRLAFGATGRSFGLLGVYKVRDPARATNPRGAGLAPGRRPPPRRVRAHPA